MKYVHLGPDEKFIDFFYQNCERLFPHQNEFLVVTDETVLRHVKNTDIVRRVATDFLASTELLGILRSCEVLVIHYLTDAAIGLLGNVPDNVIVVWSGWGGDYYLRMRDFSGWAYGDRTRAIIQQIAPCLPCLGPFYSIKCKLYDTYRRYTVEKRISRVDYFSAPIPNDFEVVKAIFPSLTARYLQLNYGSVDGLFELGPQAVSGINILVGNSADPTNNHVEVFDTLKNIDLGDRKVIVPLSYGNGGYRDKVVAEGRRILGENFQPIVDFMPLERYVGMIATCGIVIMNHRRQQAMGNIGIMLQKGAKVFLNGKGVAYDFFNKRGADVFDVGSISSDNEGVFESLSAHQIENNKRILEAFWGRQVVEDNFSQLGRLQKYPAT